MINLFFCSVGMDPFRLAMRNLCWMRWRREEKVSYRHISPLSLDIPESSFQRERRVHADLHSMGSTFILADDDCLPLSLAFVERAVDILERHPEFAILSLWPSNCVINRWTSKKPLSQIYTLAGDVYEDEEVMEHVSVGGIRFCRKGSLQEYPPMLNKGYDMEHCIALREAGYRVGLFKQIKMNHIGEGYSTVWT